MYLSLLALLVGGVLTVTPDYFHSEKTAMQTYAFNLFLVTVATTILSISISMYSTFMVLQGEVSIEEQRERTVYILALPGFYCLMCFLSSEMLLMNVLGTVQNHWDWDIDFNKPDITSEKFTLDMITFYLSAADVFESFAFTFFGTLTMESLRRAGVLQLRYLNTQGEREIRLQGCIQKWTMTPIYMFCMSLCFESVYNLLVVYCKYFHLTDLLPQGLSKLTDHIVWPDEQVVTNVFFTLDCIFSSLAIMALFSIEHVFHDDLVSVDFVATCKSMKKLKFLSNLKFWGVKIFVTVEFTLQCALVIMEKLKYGAIEQQLIYTTCMAALCLMVALLHIFAYAPRARGRDRRKLTWIADNDEIDRMRDIAQARVAPLASASGFSTPSVGSSTQNLPTGDALEQAFKAKLLEGGNAMHYPAHNGTSMRSELSVRSEQSEHTTPRLSGHTTPPLLPSAEDSSS
jgi:hypothetical protein